MLQHRTKNLISMAAATLAVAGLGLASAGTAGAAPVPAQDAPVDQGGLVNLNLTDAVVQIPIGLAANICDVAVGVLVDDLSDASAPCDASADPSALVTTQDGGPVTQEGLVNVNITDLVIQAPVAVVANVCDVAIGVLVDTLTDAAAPCDAAGAPEAVTTDDGEPPAAPVEQAGLVNLNLTGVTVQAPIALAASVCDVVVAVLVDELADGAAPCGADANPAAMVTTQDGGPVTQEGLVNVNLTDVNVQVPVGIAANVCDVDVAVLVSTFGDAASPCDAAASPTAVTNIDVPVDAADPGTDVAGSLPVDVPEVDEPEVEVPEVEVPEVEVPEVEVPEVEVPEVDVPSLPVPPLPGGAI